MSQSPSVVLIGASVRAAAQSALRGGLAPWCADLFADRDLAAIAPVQKISHYPAGVVAALKVAPRAPLAYTGALENYPRLIDALARRRPLWGNSGNVLRAVRDPLRVVEALRRAGLSAPDASLSPDALPRDGSWLCKPVRSGGGWRITPWDGSTAVGQGRLAQSTGREIRHRGGVYFQRRIEGQPCSALYVAAGAIARLLGVTRQLVGTTWSGAGPFAYAGSIGPLMLPAKQYTRFRQIGECLAAEFQLVGLFGVDAIINDAGVWPLEVNPRYPASAEVLERAGNFSAMALHAAACGCEEVNFTAPSNGGVAGKTIVYARWHGRAPTRLINWAEAQNADAAWPAVADIPQFASPISANSPVLTVLATGADEHLVESILRGRLTEVESLLTGEPAGTWPEMAAKA